MSLWRFTSWGVIRWWGRGERQDVDPVKKSRQPTLLLSRQSEDEANTPSFIPPAFFTVCSGKKI